MNEEVVHKDKWVIVLWSPHQEATIITFNGSRMDADEYSLVKRSEYGHTYADVMSLAGWFEEHLK